MTQNQYLGADLGELAAAPPEGFNDALVQGLQQIAANDFRARAREQAEIILRRRPDLVGLQEVARFECFDAPEVPQDQGCGHPSIAGAFVDHLDLTLEALNDRRLDYTEVATVKNLDLSTLEVTLPDGQVIEPGGIPFVIEGFPALLVAVDRDVILAREKTVAGPKPATFSDDVPCRESLDGCNFDVFLPVELSVPGEVFGLPFESVEAAVNFERGFVAVDATVGRRDYRFVNTHLEVQRPDPGDPLSPFFQAAQAAQLIAALGKTPLSRSLVVVGDINSSPEDMPIPGSLLLPPPFDDIIVPPYMQFVEAGFIDVWTLRRRRDPGFTCCQAPDLRNRFSILDERIDVIFTEEMPFRSSPVRVVGDRIFNKTRGGLWPSDHAGVLARLLFLPGAARFADGAW